MASRRDVRESFYTELESAASANLSADDIGQEYPNNGEQLPRIVHTDRYREDNWNTDAAPKKIRDNNDGTYDVVFTQPMEAHFDVLILAASEQTKEDIYENVRSYFEKFQHPRWDASSIHADVHDVSVDGADSADSESRDPPARGDRITVVLGYERFYSFTVESIEQVDHLIDANDDGTTDETYQTT
jgi:hypothetical protein